MRWLAVAGGVLAAVYTAFLFGQCEGRDLWQTPLLPLHLLVQGWLATPPCSHYWPRCSATAQSAIRVAAAALTGGLALHILALVTELLMPHATDTATYAAHLITRGPFRSFSGAAPWCSAFAPGRRSWQSDGDMRGGWNGRRAGARRPAGL